MYRNYHPQTNGEDPYKTVQPQSIPTAHSSHVPPGYNAQCNHHGNTAYENHGNQAVNGYDSVHSTAQPTNGASYHHHQSSTGTTANYQQEVDGRGYTTSIYVNGKQPAYDGPYAAHDQPATATLDYQQRAQVLQQQHQQQLQQQKQQQQQQQLYSQQLQQQHQHQLQQQHQQQLQQQQLQHQQQQVHQNQQVQQQHQQQNYQQIHQQHKQQQQQQQQHQNHLQHQNIYNTSEPIYQEPYAQPVIPPPPSYPAPQPGYSQPQTTAGNINSNIYSVPNSATYSNTYELEKESIKLANLSISNENGIQQSATPQAHNQNTQQPQPPPTTNNTNYPQHINITHSNNTTSQPVENEHHHQNQLQINRQISESKLYTIQDEDSLSTNGLEAETETETKTTNDSKTKTLNSTTQLKTWSVPIMYEQKTFHVIPPPPLLVDKVFVGRRDVRDPKSVPEKEIVSHKGTVRGFKNRVRAGIATFWAQPEQEILLEYNKVLQPKVARNYRQQEKGKIVVYATSMSVVRETIYRCKAVRSILQNHMVRYEERDLYMNRENQEELKHRLSLEGIDEIRLPHVFADGIRIGGAGELERLNEAGELRALLEGYQKVNARFACERCGGYRFVPCEFCHGSKRSLIRNHFTEDFFALRCMHCDDNGLRRCELCKEQQE